MMYTDDTIIYFNLYEFGKDNRHNSINFELDKVSI